MRRHYDLTDHVRSASADSLLRLAKYLGVVVNPRSSENSKAFHYRLANRVLRAIHRGTKPVTFRKIDS